MNIVNHGKGVIFMGIYTVMKKIITNGNNQLENGETEFESYNLWRENQQNKLDAFLACNRLTPTQYKELQGMFAAGE